LVLASEKCHQEKRKTVNGEDILFAMTSLGFENYAEALKIYLSKYREVYTPNFHFILGHIPLHNGTDANIHEQTQSTRGENRPGSQGFGSTAAGGPGGPANATSSASFQGGAEGTNNILGGQGDSTEHEASYGNLYGAQPGHNGATGGDGY
jgi:nuclear transcription Y subunit beta